MLEYRVITKDGVEHIFKDHREMIEYTVINANITTVQGGIYE